MGPISLCLLFQNPFSDIISYNSVELATGKNSKGCLKAPDSEKFCIDQMESIFGTNPEEFNAVILIFGAEFPK